uniref:RNase H type-1 domain-containing protein n=1 Tax=Opuntia streptacantha TaxID=393608 RepID=A0A7C8YV34_OPUST
MAVASATLMGTLLRAKRGWAEWKIRTSSLDKTTTLPSSSPHSTHQPLNHHTLIGWDLPRGGYIKINFDGSKSSEGAAAGFVLRSWQGGFITAGTQDLTWFSRKKFLSFQPFS